MCPRPMGRCQNSQPLAAAKLLQQDMFSFSYIGWLELADKYAAKTNELWHLP